MSVRKSAQAAMQQVCHPPSVRSSFRARIAESAADMFSLYNPQLQPFSTITTPIDYDVTGKEKVPSLGVILGKISRGVLRL